MGQENKMEQENGLDQAGSEFEKKLGQENESEDLNKKKKEKRISIIRELLIYVILVVLCVFIIPRYVIQRTEVDGPSMENTLHSDDSLLVEKVSYRFTKPSRFDIIVFHPPETAIADEGKDPNKEYYVKRVIGLPGETIQIIGDDIYINGKVVEEHYGKMPITYSGIATKPLKLADDEYFVMGDNREVSFDSRYEEVGPIHQSAISGKAILRIWPLKQMGTLD